MAGYARLAGLQANNLGAQLELERLRRQRMNDLFALARGVSGDLTSAATQAVGAYQAGQERDAALEERKRQEAVLAAEAEKDRQARMAELKQRAEDARGLASAKADARAALQRERLSGRSIPGARPTSSANGMPAQPVDAEAQQAAARARMAQQLGGSRRGREVLDEDVKRLSRQYGMDPALVEGRILASIRSLEAEEAKQLGAEEEAARKGRETEASVGLRGAQTRKAGVEADLKQAELDFLPEQRRLEALARKARADEMAARRARDERAAATAERQARAAEAQLEALLRKNRREELVEERGRKPSPAEAKDFRAQAEVIDRLDKLTAELQTKGYDTGWFADLANTMAQKVGWDDPEFSAWKSRANDMLAAYIHSRSGAAASDKERAFLMQAVPTASDDQDTFLAKARALRSHMEGNLDQAIRDLGAAGVDTSGLDRPAPRADAPAAPPGKTRVVFRGRVMLIDEADLQEALADGAVPYGAR